MLTLAATRVTTGIVIVFGHFICAFLVMGFWLAGGYTFDEMVNIFAVIVPMFAAYLSVIITFAFKPPATTSLPIMSPLAIVFSLLFPLAFVALLALAITLKALNFGLYSMENLIKFIGIVETLVGGYLSNVVSFLFSSKSTPASRRQKQGS